MKVITFSDNPDISDKPLYASCKKNALDLIVLGAVQPWKTNSFKLRYLFEFLQQADSDVHYLVVDAFDVIINASAEHIQTTFKSFETDILFSAEANYYFREPDLTYFYWKHYPRGKTYYDYLNSGSFMGTGQHLLQMLTDIFCLYNIEVNDDQSLQRIRSDQYVFSRFFADSCSGFFQSRYKIKLDHQQTLLGCTGGRMTTFPWPLGSKIHSFLYFKYERKLVKSFRLNSVQIIARDLTYHNGSFYNSSTKSYPTVIHIPSSRAHFAKALNRIKGDTKVGQNAALQLIAFFVSFLAYVQSIVSLGFIRFFNRGNADQREIFRYSKNYGEGYDESAEKLAHLLRAKTAFSFCHFNDGELTFIDKYLKNDHKEVWFGRKQQSYSTRLGELLLAGLQKHGDNYFVGIPCGTDHPTLRKLADQLRKSDEFTIPAMTLHHNLSRLPSMLGSMRGRKLYFLLNDHQDLTVLQKLGLHCVEENIIRLPFKNSYELYDKLKDRTFERDSVVVMMCGMLAKLLCPVWFGQNPQTTFIAFGSSLDDIIQKEKINFRLYPHEFPFTRNIHNSRGFLFGRKKPCQECYLQLPDGN